MGDYTIWAGFALCAASGAAVSDNVVLGVGLFCGGLLLVLSATAGA